MPSNPLSLMDIIFTVSVVLLQSFFPDLSLPNPILPTPTPKLKQQVLPLITIAPGKHIVSHVVDGDTITVTDGVKSEKIRLIGIDTPETVDPRKPMQCFGAEASRRMGELVKGQSVQLVADDSQGDKDRYGRLLRYVFLDDGRLINKVLIEEGYAHEYTYATPYRYQLEFKEAQKNAIDRKKGLWNEAVCPL